MTTTPIIEDTNLSNAWMQVLNRILDKPGPEITPLLITLTGFDESANVRSVLDESLNKNKLGSVQTVSETIFPDSLYRLYGKDREKLYSRYLRNLPRLKKIDSNSNGKGTYFERMIAFDSSPDKINQLEMVINSLKSKSNKRRSKLQISIFDPRVDHTNQPFQGFPCLQHVTFYTSKNNGLILNSFYAIQYLYERGYGNWLGLINLGKFIANEANIEFERFNCFIGIEKLEIPKIEARELVKKINKL